MLERLRRHLETTGLIPPGTRVLAAYSGGPDSTALLHLLQTLGIDVAAAHLHHGQRPEADEEAVRCAEFAESLGVPFVSGRADVPLMARELGMGLEEAGRRARYAFLDQAARQLECPLIATGHTRDDHVETVLFHLARGTGLAGLAGIPPRRGPVVRPLLGMTRADTRAWCEEHGLWFHDDPANVDLDLSRARIRHRVLPELRTAHPGADDAIARLADLASEEDRFLDGAAAAALERAEVPVNGDLAFLTRDCELVLDRAAMGHLPRVLFRRAVRLAFGALGGALDHHQAEVLADRFAADARGSVTGEGGTVAAAWDERTLHLAQTAPDQPFRFGLTVPGETVSDEFGWILAAVPADPPAAPPVRAARTTTLDRGKVKGQLYFRSAEPGDRIVPLGGEHPRKVADLLSEAHLSPAARRRLPIVCDLVGPVWVPGVAVAERVRPDAGTSAALSLRFGPSGSAGAP